MNKEIYVYAYQDLKSDVYDVPFFAKDDVHAKRKFYLDVNGGNGNHILAQFTEDFRIMKIGMFDLKTGVVKKLTPEVILDGVTLKNQMREKEKENAINNATQI